MKLKDVKQKGIVIEPAKDGFDIVTFDCDDGEDILVFTFKWWVFCFRYFLQEYQARKLYKQIGEAYKWKAK